jgi:hypothetical protein
VSEHRLHLGLAKGGDGGLPGQINVNDLSDSSSGAQSCLILRSGIRYISVSICKSPIFTHSTRNNHEIPFQ